MTATPVRRSLRLLLVEDSPDDAELLGFALREAPFAFSLKRVETEAGFRDALEAEPPDAVLCDYHLPRFDLARALDIVRRERVLDTPFIVVSRLIGEEAAVEAMRRGADDYLLKGRLGRLAGAIAAAVDRVQAHRERERAEAALRRTDLLNRSLLDSLAARIAVVDAQGTILAANGAWQRMHREESGTATGDAVGTNFLEQMRSRERDGGLSGMRAGIEAVIERRGPAFAIEYERPGHGGQRWELLRAVPLAESAHGAVVSIEDITPRMLAHLALRDAHRRLQQLSRRILAVQEEERRVLASRLQAEVAEPLAAHQAALLDFSQALEGTGLEPRFHPCLGSSDRILAQAAALWTALVPPGLEEGGLRAALPALARAQSASLGLAIESRVAGLRERFPAIVESACYRIAQEAIEAGASGGASRASIDAESRDGVLHLVIHHDGVVATREARGPLLGMAERAQLAGGRLKTRSSPESGTRLEAAFAREEEAEAG